MNQMHIKSVSDYREFLEKHAEEWDWIEALSHVTISRFYRDKAVFKFLENDLLPLLVKQVSDRKRNLLRVWSVGCCSGEEPYTMALIWKVRLQPQWPNVRLEVMATDVDSKLIQRAKQAAYPYSSIKALPNEWQHQLFDQRNGLFYLKPEYQRDVHFVEQDVRVTTPQGLFDLVLCRNLAFTYFEIEQQHKILDRIHAAIQPDGVLVIGIQEDLPEGTQGFSTCSEKLKIFKKVPL
ncbi:MAG: CheR family methyltransferase [Arenicellales bacterium]|nr:CheR family methyltransferase [Arenicellales bacterium]